MFKGKSVWFTLLIGVMLVTVSGVFFKGTESSRPLDNPAGGGVPSLSGPPVETRSAELHIVAAMKEDEFKQLEMKHAAHADSRPHHVYTLERIEPSTAAIEIRDRARTGMVPDIMLLPNTAITEFAATGYLAKAEDSMLGQFESSHITTAIAAQVRWNGSAWGIPVDIDPYVLVYHADSNLGSGEWPVAATYAEVAAWLKERHAGTIQAEAVEWVFTKQDASLFAAIGAEAFRQEGMPTDMPSGSELPEELQAEGIWKQGDGGSISLRLTADSYEAVLEQIAEGRALLAPVPLSALQQFAGASLLKAAVLPESRDGWSGSWQPGRSFAVSSKTMYQREAFEWIQAINDASFQLDVMRQGGGIPVSSSVSSLYSIVSQVSPSLLSAALNRMEAYSSAPSYYEQLIAVIRELELLHESGNIDRSGLSEAIEAIQRSFTKELAGPS